MAWTKQFFKKDDKHFRKYIDNTTAHGVVRIFTGKSIIRRLFWLVIVLGATTGCLYNVIDRIIFLSGSPTSTTVSLTRQENLTFPAVTVCNLNQFRSSHVSNIHPNLSELLRDVYYTDPTVPIDTLVCEYVVENFMETSNLQSLSIQDLTYIGSDPIDDFIQYCQFSGRRCDLSDFVPVFTQLGICYTFNSAMNEQALTVISTGTRAGLSLILNIEQDEYVSSNNFDAGVKVAVHPQTEYPRPDDEGIAVPPGRNAFISLRQRNITDNTKRNCRKRSDTSNFNFLQDEYEYSTASCKVECLLNSTAENCFCSLVGNGSSGMLDYPICNLSDICCQVEQQRTATNCDCPSACNVVTYDIFNSYSGFPAQYASEDLSNLFRDKFNISVNVEQDLVSVNVYFESLNVETETTNDAYGSVALLSDIGGQLGLFLGVSIISIAEFATWIVDEVKSRMFGDKLSEKKVCSCCKRSNDEPNQDAEVEDKDHEVEVDGTSF